MLRQESSVVFGLQSSRLTMQAESSNIISMEYNLSSVRCNDARKIAWTGPFRNAFRVGLDCFRGMDRAVQVLAAHCVEAQFRHCGQPGHHARTCPLNKQGTAAAEHPHACFRKGSSSTASYSAACLWGSKAHTQACTHTHTHTHTHMHTHTNKITRVNTHRQARTHTHTLHSHKHTDIHAHAHIHTHKHTGTHARTHTHMCTRAHTLTRTHAYVCTRCARDGLRQFFSVASDAPILVFSAIC